MKTIDKLICFNILMDIHSKLSEKPYYSNYRNKFTHYYDVYFTNVDKIDRIMIDSLQKGYSPQTVISTLDRIWEDCNQRERDFRMPDGRPVNDRQAYFESYLRNVLRKILVFDDYNMIFSVL